MSKRDSVWTFFTALLLCGMSTGARAALIGVLPFTPGGTDYQGYYDNVANLTWLTDANANGPMVWSAARSWAAGLDVNGVTGWRLPTSAQPDPACDTTNGGGSHGYNCTGSEMGNLFYNVMGGLAATDLASHHNSDYGLFSNIQPDYYWSSTESVIDPAREVWLFSFGHGGQFRGYKTLSLYAWAVHTGNAEVASVPAPSPLLLVATGLGALVAGSRWLRLDSSMSSAV